MVVKFCNFCSITGSLSISSRRYEPPCKSKPRFIFLSKKLSSNLNKFDDAIKDFDEALNINPKHLDSLFFKAITQLKIGDYKNGWKNYEHRWGTTNFPSPKRIFSQPCWNGIDNLKDKIILFILDGLALYASRIILFELIFRT